MISKMCLLTWKLQILGLVLYFRDCGGQMRVTIAPLLDMEREHIPDRIHVELVVNDTKVPEDYESPDFRIEEEAWGAHSYKFFLEENRPYRFSPFFKQYDRWHRSYYQYAYARYLGCYCTTVYKRLTLLAGCAVVTSRHILTTATSTELVLQNYRNEKDLENILGAWYDYDDNVFNSSLYMTPARIHYHPEYMRPHQVNLTHPLPFQHDLAIWAATVKFYGNYFTLSRTVICRRGAPHQYEYTSSTPRSGDLALIVGFQFVKAQRKIPAPWYRYVVRSRTHTIPCPKTEWQWFHCLPGPVWGKYGVESGAAWHRALENRYWIYDGLIGLCAFSSTLRADTITHYFTVLNTHPVMDFFYDAYMGNLPYEYLDSRFHDTKWKAPELKVWSWISWLFSSYTFGTEDYYYYKNHLPWYKK